MSSPGGEAREVFTKQKNGKCTESNKTRIMFRGRVEHGQSTVKGKQVRHRSRKTPGGKLRSLSLLLQDDGS